MWLIVFCCWFNFIFINFYNFAFRSLKMWSCTYITWIFSFSYRYLPFIISTQTKQNWVPNLTWSNIVIHPYTTNHDRSLLLLWLYFYLQWGDLVWDSTQWSCLTIKLLRRIYLLSSLFKHLSFQCHRCTMFESTLFKSWLLHSNC